MADMHNIFLKFNAALSIKGQRRSSLIRSRKAVEKAIVNHFKANSKLPVPQFYIQGSFKMGTVILKKDNTYDVDLGVYFFDHAGIQPKTLQQNVLKAVKNQTNSGTQHLDKCIRIVYAGEFNIDLPIYSFPKRQKHPMLATKSGWIKSDPRELRDWFDKKKDKEGQLIRITKYFKAWANYRGFKMPSVIALSVWVAKHYKSSTRDDIALINIAKSIKSNFLFGIVECKCPAQPHDDLVDKLKSPQKKRFKKALDSLILEGTKALNEPNEKKCRNIWAQQMGNKFPKTI